jgi:hypothetical protein
LQHRPGVESTLWLKIQAEVGLAPCPQRGWEQQLHEKSWVDKSELSTALLVAHSIWGKEPKK